MKKFYTLIIQNRAAASTLMIRNPRIRRRVSLGLLAAGGVLFLLAPENALISLIFAGLGVLLEVIGIRLEHADQA